MITSALVVATLLCFALPSTRGIGVMGVALLLYFFPLTTLALLVLGGVIFYFFYLYKK